MGFIPTYIDDPNDHEKLTYKAIEFDSQPYVITTSKQSYAFGSIYTLNGGGNYYFNSENGYYDDENMYVTDLWLRGSNYSEGESIKIYIYNFTSSSSTYYTIDKSVAYLYKNSEGGYMSVGAIPIFGTSKIIVNGETSLNILDLPTGASTKIGSSYGNGTFYFMSNSSHEIFICNTKYSKASGLCYASKLNMEDGSYTMYSYAVGYNGAILPGNEYMYYHTYNEAVIRSLKTGETYTLPDKFTNIHPYFLYDDIWSFGTSSKTDSYLFKICGITIDGTTADFDIEPIGSAASIVLRDTDVYIDGNGNTSNSNDYTAMNIATGSFSTNGICFHPVVQYTKGSECMTYATCGSSSIGASCFRQTMISIKYNA